METIGRVYPCAASRFVASSRSSSIFPSTPAVTSLGSLLGQRGALNPKGGLAGSLFERFRRSEKGPWVWSGLKMWALEP